MAFMLTSGPSDDNPNGHVYFVQWLGYSQDENTWETHENVMESSKELLEQSYEKNPMMEKDGRYRKEKGKTKVNRNRKK